MALKATIYKAALQIADMDRNLYADHQLTLALHPSETEERLMMRLLAFCLNVPADDHGGALTQARGLADADEPDLWQHDLTGQLLHWVEVGQPEDRRITRACGRAGRVTLYGYAASTPERNGVRSLFSTPRRRSRRPGLPVAPSQHFLMQPGTRKPQQPPPVR